jgi:ribosomal RNA-processing protein 7
MGKVKKTPAVIKESKPLEDKTNKQLEEFQGFKVLPVVVDSAKNTRHYFYMRKHESKALVDEDIKDRTLFLLNLPADTTDRHIKKLFKGHSIDQITYSDSGSSVSEDYWKIAAATAAAVEEEAPTTNKKSKKNKKAEEEHKSETRELRRLFTSGSSAHVVFSSEEDLDQVLNMRRVEKKWAKDDESEQPLGFERKV